MPLLVHRVPKYGNHRATGQAIVTLDGKDFYVGPHGTKASRNEYDRLVDEFGLSVVNATGSITDQQRTFRKLVSQHLQIEDTNDVSDDLA